jgi:anti-repressor protein
MTAITPFEFPATGERVRTVMWDGAPGFVGKDVCDVLQHTNHRVALARLPERMKGVTEVDTPGGPQQMTVITEPGVYRLVMRSNLPAAEAFQDWIAEDVVPAIRQTGTYNVAAAYQIPQTLPEALRAYATEVEAHEVTRAALTEAAPKAESWDVLAEAQGDYSLREAAQILDRDPHITTGQNRLAAYIREIGWVDACKRPYQAQVDNGRLVLRARHFTKGSGEEATGSQIRITVKGLKELRRRMLSGQQQLVVIEGGR